MPRYCVIIDNYIQNVMIASSKESAEAVTNTRCEEQNESFPYGTGYKFDGENWIDTYVPPQDIN